MVCNSRTTSSSKYLMSVFIVVLVLLSLPAWADDELPSWQGMVKRQLTDYIHSASTPGDKGFIPPSRRVAVFDVDGTLISEKPMFTAMEISKARLAEICPKPDRPAELAKLCRAAETNDREFLLKDIDFSLSAPFAGMSFGAYEQFCAEFFADQTNKAKSLPYRRMIYKPMLELIELLKQNGFQVWLCSGSPQFMLRAIGPKYLGVPAERCIGTRYETVPVKDDQKLRFVRGGAVKSLNLKLTKAENLLQVLGGPPVLVFGNSSGDLAMMRFAGSSPFPALRLMLVHDDPREFVYGHPSTNQQAWKMGAILVSMKNSFKTVFLEQ